MEEKNGGFDVCFSIEAKVPTWEPMVTPDERRVDGAFRWGEPVHPSVLPIGWRSRFGTAT
jgi:hypothetical protein